MSFDFDSARRGGSNAGGAYQAQNPRGGVRDGDSEYIRLAQEVEKSLGQLTQSVAGLQKMVNLMGTPQDTPELQKQFVQRQEFIRKQSTQVEKSIRQLGQFDGGNSNEARTRRVQQDTLAKRFREVLNHFRQCCELAMSKEKTHIASDRQRAASFREERERYGDRSGLVPADHMQLAQMDRNQEMIRERDEGMKEIEKTMTEVNEIFRDLASLVHDQGFRLDDIESNMQMADTHVEKGTGELAKASNYQKKARNKMLCLLVIVAIVAVILIAVLVTQVHK